MQKSCLNVTALRFVSKYYSKYKDNIVFVVVITYLAYSISTSHTAMMWQMLPRRTKKWKTECIKRFLVRL